jgi:hypothetical protein
MRPRKELGLAVLGAVLLLAGCGASQSTATTGVATAITATSATLNGSVNDNGHAADGGGSTKCGFRIGPTSTGPWTDITSTPSSFTGTASPVGYATGLTPGTTYYFWVVDQNSAGPGYGGVLSFTTA